MEFTVVPQRIAGELPIRRNVGMYFFKHLEYLKKKMELISVSIQEINITILSQIMISDSIYFLFSYMIFNKVLYLASIHRSCYQNHTYSRSNF